MKLVDTNIILEILLERENIEKARNVFKEMQTEKVLITDFSLHSVGIFLVKGNKPEVYKELIDDIVSTEGIEVVGLTISELADITEISQKYNLDYDDAYQYAIAEKYDLEIISFDKDFDRTPRKRKKPE